jgi:acetyl esterase/lipase
MSVTGPDEVMGALSPDAKRAARARLGDYVIALGLAPTMMPVIGRHFEPVAGMAALGVWAGRFLPDYIAAGKSPDSAQSADIRGHERAETASCLQKALRDVVSAGELDAAWPLPTRFAPFLSANAQRKHVYRGSVRYGDDAGQLLDVWRCDDLPKTPAPVLIFIPGGAWVFGSRLVQGHELMARFAEMGWVCLSVQYRTSPRHRWPRQITDVKAAIAWGRANVDQFGGDRRFIAVAGCSAGGHLAALAGLTPNDPEWQKNLPAGADTSVDAVVTIYGRYDWQDDSTLERARFVEFLERVVVKRSRAKYPEIFRRASPLARISAGSPPFLVVHGSRDAIIPIAEAQVFVDRLRAVSRDTVCYAELPGAGHAFDLVDAVRTRPVVHAIGLFLNHVYHRPRTRMGEAV